MPEYVTSTELDTILEKPDDELLMPRVYLEQIRDTLRATEESVARWQEQLEIDWEYTTYPVVRGD